MHTAFKLDETLTLEVGHDLFPRATADAQTVDLGLTLTPKPWPFGQSRFPDNPPHLSPETARDPKLTFYGPQPCPECGCQVVVLANNDARHLDLDQPASFDYPSGPIYPNTRWEPHRHRACPTPVPQTLLAHCLAPSQARAIASAILSAATEARR